MKPKSVLVVEDNDLNMKLMRNILQIGGYHVLEAEDAETGIQLAYKHKPDLILMDIGLPGMDGLQATEILKKDAELKEIPVIAMTGEEAWDSEEGSLAAGCVDHIRKPINIQKLLKIIEDLLAQ